MQKRRHKTGKGRACGGLTGAGLGLALLGLELFEDALREVGARLLRSLHVRRCRLELHPDRAKRLLEACVLHTHTCRPSSAPQDRRFHLEKGIKEPLTFIKNFLSGGVTSLCLPPEKPPVSP